MGFKDTPLRTTQGYGIQVSRGEIGGTIPVVAYGKLVAGGPVTDNIIWPDGAFTAPDQVTGENISLISTSAEDGAGTLTGVLSVEIHYLDINLNPARTTIELNGTTEVTNALTGVRFIQDMHAETVGSVGKAVGTITAYRTGSPTAIFQQISVGKVRAASSLRMVPKGKRAVIVGVVGSSISGTAAAKADISLIATELEANQYLAPFIFFPQASIGVQDNSIPYSFPIPAIFNEGTIFGMNVTLDKGATVAADIFGWYEDTPA